MSEQRASKKLIIFLMTAGLLVCVAIGAAILLRVKSGTDRESMPELKDIMSDALKNQIVAQIDGIPVSASELEFKRYLREKNGESLDDMAILNQIAREHFVLKSAEAAGVTVSHEEIMQQIRAEEEYVESEAARGNGLMIKRQEEDREFLTALGMTKEEFYEKIYADMLLYSKTYIAYGTAWYEADPGSGMTFDEFIDREFEKADIAIIRYKDAGN
mgnify:CR=1 FL=1